MLLTEIYHGMEVPVAFFYFQCLGLPCELPQHVVIPAVVGLVVLSQAFPICGGWLLAVGTKQLQLQCMGDTNELSGPIPPLSLVVFVKKSC